MELLVLLLLNGKVQKMTQASNLAKGGSNFNTTGNLSLTTGVTGTLPVANGGTGSTTTTGAANAILPSQTSNSGKYLTTDGTNTSWGTVTSNPGTVTSVSGTAPVSVATGTSTPVISMAAATASVNGYMTSTFASKLDGITAGATVNTLTAGTGISVSASTGASTIANTGVTSAVAGTGITVSGATGAVTISSTATGTVTSVATGNGLSGGTITSTGTLVVACPTQNTVGSYAQLVFYYPNGQTGPAFGTNYACGSGDRQLQLGATRQDQDPGGASVDYAAGTVSGTWKWMGINNTATNFGGWIRYCAVACRVS
jgi:hypothetical protein